MKNWPKNTNKNVNQSFFNVTCPFSFQQYWFLYQIFFSAVVWFCWHYQSIFHQNQKTSKVLINEIFAMRLYIQAISQFKLLCAAWHLWKFYPCTWTLSGDASLTFETFFLHWKGEISSDVFWEWTMMIVNNIENSFEIILE